MWHQRRLRLQQSGCQGMPQKAALQSPRGLPRGCLPPRHALSLLRLDLEAACPGFMLIRSIYMLVPFVFGIQCKPAVPGMPMPSRSRSRCRRRDTHDRDHDDENDVGDGKVRRRGSKGKKRKQWHADRHPDEVPPGSRRPRSLLTKFCFMFSTFHGHRWQFVL